MDNNINVINDLDMSIWGLILEADFVVRLVMLSLLFLSIFSWGIIFEKITKIRNLKKKSKQFEDDFWSGINIEKLHRSIENSPSHPMEAIFVTGMKELTATGIKNINHDVNIVLEKRIEKAMFSTLNREMEKLEKNLNFLATTGSSAPFIGLFGTVWGIMNSFQSIATSKNTSLAIVAPGIAEALLATAMGLLAAIPAVMAYNKISSDTNRYYNSLEVFLYDLSNILSKHIHNKK